MIVTITYIIHFSVVCQLNNRSTEFDETYKKCYVLFEIAGCLNHTLFGKHFSAKFFIKSDYDQ